MSLLDKEQIRAYALDHGADLVGFVSTAHLDEVTPTRYKPGRLWPEAKTAISIGRGLLRGAVAVGTTDRVQNARWVAWRTCSTLNDLALELGRFLERRGAMALPLSAGTMEDPDWSNQGIFGELSHRHIAAEAGLGAIGVPTYIVTPEFGPRAYFNTILTDLELESDPKLDWDPCADCPDLCARACPNDAISRGRRTIRKGRCIPLAMPHGVQPLQKYIRQVLASDDAEAALKDFDFARLHRATVHGVGTIAGCFYCLEACPVGKGAGD